MTFKRYAAVFGGVAVAATMSLAPQAMAGTNTEFKYDDVVALTDTVVTGEPTKSPDKCEQFFLWENFGKVDVTVNEETGKFTLDTAGLAEGFYSFEVACGADNLPNKEVEYAIVGVEIVDELPALENSSKGSSTSVKLSSTNDLFKGSSR